MDQRCEQPEVGSTEEVTNVVDIKTDPTKANRIAMDYTKDLKQVRHSQIQDISITPIAEPSPTPIKSEHVMIDTVTSEFKPYNYFLEDEIDIMNENEGKLHPVEAAPVVSTASPSVITHTSSKTPRVKEEFNLKPPPFKLKAKRIEMKKSSMLRISEGYTYGLKDDKDLVVRSTAGNYSRHFGAKENQESDSQGEFVEEIDEKPTDLKPPAQETEVNGSSEGCRNELFEEI